MKLELGYSHVSQTLTLNVIVSMTKTRSGKTPATSSTLEKYWIGSLTSRSSSNNLNFPTEYGRKIRMKEEWRIHICTGEEEVSSKRK